MKSIIFAASMALALSACGGGSESDAQAAASQPASSVQAPSIVQPTPNPVTPTAPATPTQPINPTPAAEPNGDGGDQEHHPKRRHPDGWHHPEDDKFDGVKTTVVHGDGG